MEALLMQTLYRLTFVRWMTLGDSLSNQEPFEQKMVLIVENLDGIPETVNLASLDGYKLKQIQMNKAHF